MKHQQVIGIWTDTAMETFTRKTFQLDLFKNIEIIQIARKVSSFVVKRLKGRRWANKDHNIFDDLQPKWLDTWWLGSFFGRIHNLLVIRRWSGFLTDWWYLGFRCFKRNPYSNHTWRTAHTKVGFHYIGINLKALQRISLLHLLRRKT